MKSQSELKRRLHAATVELPSDLKRDVERAAQQLATAGVTTLQQLERRLRDSETDASLLAALCYIAGRLGESRFVQSVAEVFHRSVEPLVVWEAAKALAALREAESLEALLPSLDQTEIEVRKVAAAWTMGAARYRRAVSRLIDLLKNADGSTPSRAHAAEALGVMRASEAIGSLMAALADPSPEVRYWSIYALGMLKTTDALGAIERTAESDDGVTGDGSRVADEARWAASQIRGKKPRDCKGRRITVGTRIRLLKVPDWLLNELPDDERTDLRFMVGKVFRVREINEVGQPYVQRKWLEGLGGFRGHGLYLDAHEMEVVEPSKATRRRRRKPQPPRQRRGNSKRRS